MQFKRMVFFQTLAIAMMVAIHAMADFSFIAPEYQTGNEEIPKLKNPVTVEYLKAHLSDQTPRLVLNPQIERHLRKALKHDPVVQNMYKAIKLNGKQILDKPLL